MKAIIIFTALLLGFSSCKKVDCDCMHGKVIGQIRSSGGGLAVQLDKKYRGTVEWQGRKNVIELLNIPSHLKASGNTFYFKSHLIDASERGNITADGDESLKTILYGDAFSIDKCPE